MVPRWLAQLYYNRFSQSIRSEIVLVFVRGGPTFEEWARSGDVQEVASGSEIIPAVHSPAASSIRLSAALSFLLSDS